MSTGAEVALRDLAPPIRGALLAAARREDRCRALSELRIESSLQDEPAYLVLGDRRSRAAGIGPGLEAQLTSLVTERPWQVYPTDAAIVIVLLSCWDRVLRELAIFDGNVYLASEGAVAALIDRVEARPAVPAIETTLSDLEALQVIYRFPVALKFRGVYSRASQCRANCWGREMASCLTADPTGPVQRWMRSLTDLGRSWRDEYISHFQLLRREDASPQECWASSRSLPVPVLI